MHQAPAHVLHLAREAGREVVQVPLDGEHEDVPGLDVRNPLAGVGVAVEDAEHDVALNPLLVELVFGTAEVEIEVAHIEALVVGYEKGSDRRGLVASNPSPLDHVPKFVSPRTSCGANVSTVDDVDREILYHLQRDARLTATEIGERTGVSDTTVRNRIAALEEDGIIESYTTRVNYERAGYQRAFHFTCSVPIIEREEAAKDAIEIPGVVSVTERMTGQGNLLVEAVGEDPDDVTRVARLLTELGVEVVDETVVRSTLHSPLSYLGDGMGSDDEESDAKR